MTLFPIKTSTVFLPTLVSKNIKIGGNSVQQYTFVSKQVEVDFFDADVNGWWLLKTPLQAPYNQVFIRIPKKKKTEAPGPFCLELVRACGLEDIDAETSFRWIEHPALGREDTPDEIVRAWANQFIFREDRPEINQTGLRAPQLGALHAISAYFSTRQSTEPATVVLPTGTGKTETMLAGMVYRQAPKLLVIVPSRALREQIANKFLTLGVLPQLGVVPETIHRPCVSTITSGIRSQEEARVLLEESNVLIATAQVLKSSNPAAIDCLCEGLTDLFVDEAHHVTAKTWAEIRDRFAGKRIVQFTATPFRNDGNALGGRVIFNYSMGEAQAAGYFRPINLLPVEEYFTGEDDRAIATKAVHQLRKDIEAGRDHLMMARAQSKSRAEALLPLYQEIAADFHPIIVHSGMGDLANKEALGALFSRESRIVICVDMLGEGFDLPNLKIAAIHDIHKSLAITLQFIGRFTRASENVSDASVVVNVADPAVETGLQHLYAQGADWDKVLRRLAEERITREIRLQEVVDHLKNKGNLHNQLSLWNLRPTFSSVLFKTTCQKWVPEKFKDILPNAVDHWYAISEEENLLVLLAIQSVPVKWGKFRDLNDNLYKLVIAHWDEARSGLFIYSNDYKWISIEKLAKALCEDRCELLSGPKVFNVFNGLHYPLVRNLGASQVGAISFTQYFGTNVTEGLLKIEKATSYLSNLAGLGYDNGEKVVWGCSQKKGKIWSVNSGSISDWTDWAKLAWDKVTSGEVEEENVTRNFLRPKRIDAPYEEHAVSVSWGDHIQSDPEDRVFILFGEAEIPLYLVDLKIEGMSGEKSYQISVSTDEQKSVYKFTVDKEIPSGFGYGLVSGDPIFVKRGNRQAVPIEEYLTEDPWIIQYVNGSYSYNCFLIEIPQEAADYEADQIELWDWGEVNIRKESMGKERDENTVQWKTYLEIQDQYDVVINDDDSGEAADLVGLKVDDDQIYLGLIHCKYSGGNAPGARVNDLYEVCGQAQKSIQWKHLGISRLYNHIRCREQIWKKGNVSRFLKGTLADFANIKSRARTASVNLQVYVVQPGLKKDEVTPQMLKILAGTELYLQKTAQAEFVVVGS